jgi:hypothetical protein
MSDDTAVAIGTLVTISLASLAGVAVWKAVPLLSLFPLRVVAGIRLPKRDDMLWRSGEGTRTVTHPSGVVLLSDGNVYVPGIGDVETLRARAYARRVRKVCARQQRRVIQQRLDEKHVAALEALCGEVEPPEFTSEEMERARKP